MFKKLSHLDPANYDKLLDRFNDRDSEAIGDVYSLLYRELFHYAHSLFRDTNEDPKDIIQDVFLDVFQKKHLKFDTLDKLRAFIFVVIKNRLRVHCNRDKYVNKVKGDILLDEKRFMLQMAESEIISIIPSALDLLPKECAKSFRMFLDGYDIKEIAEKLGKKQSTIYNQRKSAIATLRAKLDRDKIWMLGLFV